MILLKCAIDHFANNMRDIMCTIEWQSFIKDNFTIGNELVIKSIKKLKATYDMNNFCLFIEKKKNSDFFNNLIDYCFGQFM